MSKENVVEFYEQHVLKNDSLKSKLDGAASRDEFAQTAIAEGEKAGLSFTKEELGAVMAATEQKVTGSLSEEQLDGVVGGAGVTGISAAPTVKVTTLPTLTTSKTLDPASLGGAKASTIGCCW